MTDAEIEGLLNPSKKYVVLMSHRGDAGEVWRWCREHIETRNWSCERISGSKLRFGFAREADRVLFLLAWGETPCEAR